MLSYNIFQNTLFSRFGGRKIGSLKKKSHHLQEMLSHASPPRLSYSFLFQKTRQLLALQTPLTYITLYYWYFDVRYTKKYNARRRALYVIMLLFHYYYMQLQCYKRVLLEKEERGKNFRKIIWKKRYASNNVRWNWRQWSCSWYLIWLLSTCTKMVEKSQISGNVPIQFAHEIAKGWQLASSLIFG